jgi:glutathione synthase/RimK-type ligase-like ATP-grasp enzyme
LARSRLRAFIFAVLVMVYMFGPNNDTTTRYFVREATKIGAEVQWVDLSRVAKSRWRVEVGGVAELHDGGRWIVVSEADSVYPRLVLPSDGEDLEEVDRASRRLLAALAAWLELSCGRIVNRPGHALDNGSKPLHEAWLGRSGFLVPESLTSSDPHRLRSFAECQPVVVKTISGIRADCRRVDANELKDFHPEQGPIHLQHAVDGLDIRAHVVGKRVIAVGIKSRAVDYRIANDADYFSVELPADLARRVVEATFEMGLIFAGWDFKVSDADGRFYTLEVNPMPGYHPYDLAVERRITRALIEYLEGDL